jgi:acid phosphatase
MIVMLHHPVFSSGAHGDEKGYSFLLPDLLSQYPVAAVLSGHDHIYERSVKDGIYYVVFGGAGGNLYNSEGKNDFAVIFRKTHGFLLFTPQNDIMKVNAIDIDGKPIEEFSFPILQQAGR